MNIMKIYTPFLQNKQGYYTGFNNNPNKVQNLSFRGELTSDAVQLSSPYQRALGKLQKITKDEYDSLSASEKTALRIKISKLPNKEQLKKDIKMHQFAAESLRQAFDMEFGKDKYVVVPIGRSLSSISRLLALKIGEENVKNIPMSSMHQYYIEGLNFSAYLSNIERFKSQRGFKEVKNYLESIGLSRNVVKNSGKTYIITDYACSGMSLEGAYTVLSSDALCGNEKKNVIFATLNDVASLTGKKAEIKNLEDDMLASNYKKYSFVGKTRQDFIGYAKAANQRILRQNNSKSAESEKLFGFALMDDEFNRRKKPYKKLVFMPKPPQISGQKQHIWLNAYEQLQSDLKSDVLQIYNLRTRMQAPRDSFYNSNQKIWQDAAKSVKKLKEKADKVFSEKFPLEFRYYKNRKEFENVHFQNSDYHSQVICREVPDFGANSKLYRFFDETYNNLNLLMYEMTISNADIDCMNDFCRKLAEYEVDMNLERIAHGTMNTQKFYYKRFRPELYGLFDKISAKYTPEYCDKLADDAKNAYKERTVHLKAVEQMFTDELSKILDRYKGTRYPQRLEKLIQHQESSLSELEHNAWGF